MELLDFAKTDTAARLRAAAKRGEYGMLPHDILPELGALFAENQR